MFDSLDTRVRGRVVNSIKSRFKTIEEAEDHFNLTVSNYLQELSLGDAAVGTSSSAVNKCTQTEGASSAVEPCGVSVTDNSTQTSNVHDDETRDQQPLVPDIINLPIPSVIQLALNNLLYATSATTLIELILFLLNFVDHNATLEITNKSFLKLANAVGIDSNPGDYAKLSLNAMSNLQFNNKPNIMYKLAYCLATKRSGAEDYLFPMSRMPFGMVQYQIEFFSCTNISQVCIVSSILTTLPYTFN